MQTTSTFSLDSVIPLVGRLIREIQSDGAPVATHEAIARRLLSDPAGRRLATAAFREQDSPVSADLKP